MSNDNSNASKMQVWKRVSADNDHINIDLKNLDNKYKEDFENIVSCVIRGYLPRLCSHNFKRASKHRIYFGYETGSSGEYMLQLVYDSLLFHAVTTFGTDIVSKQDIEEIYKEFPCHGMVILKTDDQKSEVYQLYFYRRNKLIDGDDLNMQLQISQTICGEHYNEQESLSIIIKAILMYPVAHFTKGSGKIISTDSFNEGLPNETAPFVKVVDKYRRKNELAFYEKLIQAEED